MEVLIDTVHSWSFICGRRGPPIGRSRLPNHQVFGDQMGDDRGIRGTRIARQRSEGMLASSRGVDFATVLDIQIVIALHCAPRARAYKKPDDWLVGDQSVPHLGERLFSLYSRDAVRTEDAKALAFASSAGVEDQFKEAADRLREFEAWREDQFKALPVSEHEDLLKWAAARRGHAAQFKAAAKLKKLESANLDDLDEDEKERVLQDKDALREKASQFLVNKAKNEATMAVLTDREKTAKEKKNAYTRSAADYSRAQTQLAKLESLRTGG